MICFDGLKLFFFCGYGLKLLLSITSVITMSKKGKSFSNKVIYLTSIKKNIIHYKDYWCQMDYHNYFLWIKVARFSRGSFEREASHNQIEFYT